MLELVRQLFYVKCPMLTQDTIWDYSSESPQSNKSSLESGHLVQTLVLWVDDLEFSPWRAFSCNIVNLK